MNLELIDYEATLEPEIGTEALIDEVVTPEADEPVTGWRRLLGFAAATGDISGEIDVSDLGSLGAKVVEDWERDQASREEWAKKVEAALKEAAQEEAEKKTYPFDGASNVKYPLLTVAAQQFAARAYPAVVRGDEAAQVKVFGRDPNGLKAAQAQRVKEYLNYNIFYRVTGWEADTDALLHQLPICGTAFRKVWWEKGRGLRSELVTGLRLTVAMNATSLEEAPRVTQDFDLYPYQIKAKQRQGLYRDVELSPSSDDDQAHRVLLEQHRLEDLDGDGIEEPYIITVDKETTEVLRIDPAFTADDIMDFAEGRTASVRRWMPFVKYSFLPDIRGRFYDVGFGHLLGPITEVINTGFNQLLDAGHAQNAGGGFISSDVRLQGTGQSAVLRWRPGEYKTVNASGAAMQQAIYERTFPQPSPVLFQMLGMVMEAAQDIASIKDVMTGDAPRNAPVGTTLALIEQGLQVFTAIYKRIYRAEREELAKMHELIARYGDPADYVAFIDHPQADLMRDFDPRSMDVRPVSDPQTVTRMQRLALAQFLMPFMQDPALDGQELRRRIFEAAGVEDIDSLWNKQPAQPDPRAMAAADATAAKAEKDRGAAYKSVMEGHRTREEGQALNDARRLQFMAGAPGDPMGVPGLPPGFGGPAANVA